MKICGKSLIIPLLIESNWNSAHDIIDEYHYKVLQYSTILVIQVSLHSRLVDCEKKLCDCLGRRN